MISKTRCSGLVLITGAEVMPDGREIPTADYYARGIGWTSFGVALTTWTATEQDAVRRWRESSGAG